MSDRAAAAELKGHIQSITVYCSSSSFIDPDFHAPAVEVGRRLALANVNLVYGGGSVGLMGELSRASREAGGRVIGVITRKLVSLERACDQCDELIVVESMRERKRLLAERGDAFLILPGGIGTYEEFFEILVARHLEEHDKPIDRTRNRTSVHPLLDSR